MSKPLEPQDAAATFVAVCLGLLLPALLGKVMRMVRRHLHLLTKIPRPPTTGWLTGHLRPLARNDYYRQVLEWANQLGPVYSFRVFYRTTVVVSDPTLAQQVGAVRHLCNEDHVRQQSSLTPPPPFPSSIRFFLCFRSMFMPPCAPRFLHYSHGLIAVHHMAHP